MKNRKLSGISRVDSGATHGWFVRAYRDGKVHSKFFSDLKNKSKSKALALALQHRDKLHSKLGPPASKLYRIHRRNKNNTSGVIGVCRTKRVSPTGTVREFFIVTWRPQANMARNMAFSIHTLGEKEAFRRAVAFRKKQEKEILAKAQKLTR